MVPLRIPGGLMQNLAPTIYTYPSVDVLLQAEAAGGHKTALPGSGGARVTDLTQARCGVFGLTKCHQESRSATTGMRI
jgi:hypothetical protein